MTAFLSRLKQPRFKLLLIGLFLILLGLFFVTWNTKTSVSVSFDKLVSACSGVVKEHKFSCYRAAIDKHYGQTPTEFADFLQSETASQLDERLKNQGDISYAIFGTNCHTFYHAAGDFIATYMSDQSLESLISIGPSRCTNGYTMGLYKRLALIKNFETGLLKDFWLLCREGAQNQCGHEIGHLLHDKYTYSILQLLDRISAEEYSLNYPANYNYTHSTTKNLDAPFEECREIIPDSNKAAQCLTGIGHNLFLFSEFAPDGYKSMLKDCNMTKAENLDDCLGFLFFRIGINDAAPKILSGKVSEGTQVCEEVGQFSQRQDLKFHCYLGIGGGIGLYVDSEYPEEIITDQNAVTISGQLLGFAKLCKSTPEGFIDKCLAGLLGTRYARLYNLLKLYDERIEKLRPTLDSDFEVVG